MRRYRVLLALVAWFAVCSAMPALAAGNRAPEAEAKAAIVFNVLLFATWPRGRERPGQTLTLCIVEDAGVENALREKVEGQSIGKMKLAVESDPPQPEDLRRCDAIFIGGNDPSGLFRTAAAVRGLPILVLGEGPMALESGAMIALTLSGGRYVIDINLAALRRENLSVSSKLLRLARKVFD